MNCNDRLRQLVDLSAPYWAAEREVVRAYFHSPERTAASDRLWLRRQCYKELWGSGVGDRDEGLFQWRAKYLAGTFERIDRGVDRHVILGVIDDLQTEFLHYCLFADVHDSLGKPALDPTQLSGWPADDELARLRYECRRRHQRAGECAVAFTEGGHGALYAVGMALVGTGEVNDRIAAACKRVYHDEIGHMRRGLGDVSREEFSGSEWDGLQRWITAILRQRLHMRNEQFGYPIAAARMRTLEAGAIEPLAFDYGSSG